MFTTEIDIKLIKNVQRRLLAFKKATRGKGRGPPSACCPTGFLHLFTYVQNIQEKAPALHFIRANASSTYLL